MTDLVDPGWRPALPAVVPFMGSRLIQGQPFVIILRAVWVAFFSAVFLIGIVVTLVVSSSDPTGSTLVGVGAVGIAAVIAAAGSAWARRRRAAKDPTADSPGEYRTRLFAQIAFSELPAIVGFVFALVGGRTWIYYAGGAITLIALVLAAPTRRDVAAQGPTVRLAFLTPPGN